MNAGNTDDHARNDHARNEGAERVHSPNAAGAETFVSPGMSSDPTSLELGFLAPPEQPGEIGRLGGYRALEIVGAGGMGIVFRAEDLKLKRQVALKTLRPSIAISQAAKKRFLREAEATAAIEHDHIVTIFQVGEDRGIPYIAMQFLQGESLEDRLNREERLDQALAVRIAYQVALGLAAAHERGLIHRDIKPGNIWLDEKQDRVKIVDFGLARSISENEGLTISGMVLGTPKYMSPEQANGEAVDHRCDLFSLGSVLYHMVTGRQPFVGGNLTATLMAVTSIVPEPLARLCPELDAELVELIGRLMAKDPQQRPASAGEVAAVLRRVDQRLSHSADGAPVSFALDSSPQSPRLAPPPIKTPPPFVGSSPQPQPSGAKRGRRKSLWISAVGAALAIALITILAPWVAGIIFTIKTDKGTLTVEVDGDDFAATVQGRAITIKNTKTGETHTIVLDQPEQKQALMAGSYLVIDADSEMAASPKSFTIREGQQSVVKIDWLPAGAAANNGSDQSDAETKLRQLLSSAILVYNFEKGTFAPDDPRDLPKTLQDIGPADRAGVFEGPVAFEESIAGKAYVCDGTGCAVRIPGLQPLMPEGNKTITVSFWHRTAKAKLGMMFDCGVHTRGGFDIVSLDDQRYQINFEGNHFWSPDAYELNHWRHIVVVFDRPNCSMYVDSKKVGTWELAPPENDFVFDSWGRLGGQVKLIKQDERYYQGLIDEVVILPQAASDDDIELLYDWTKSGKVLPTIPDAKK